MSCKGFFWRSNAVLGRTYVCSIASFILKPWSQTLLLTKIVSIFFDLRRLDLIHHQGLHIVLGSFRTSPAQILYVVAHELFLASHHLNLAVNYVLKQESPLKNPAYNCIFEPKNFKLFEDTWWKISPLGICMLPLLEKYKLNLKVKLIDDASFLDIAPWMLSAPTVWFDLTNLKKDTSGPWEFQTLHIN